MKWIKPIKILAFLILLLNVPPVSGLLTFAFVDAVGVPFHFITHDLRYQANGGVALIKKTELYLEYVKKFPNQDHILYRTESRNWFHIFRWREYITRQEWKQPYLELPPDYPINFLSYEIEENPPYIWSEQQKKWIKR